MDIVKSLLKPENGKLAILLTGLIMLGRSFYYFLIDESNSLICTTAQCTQPQGSIMEIFGVEIPMFVMTIMWPLVFTILNLLHEKIRIASQVFYSILAFHFIACLLAALSLYGAGAIYEQENQNPVNFLADTFGSIVFVVTLTLFSTITSAYLYKKNFQLFKSA